MDKKSKIILISGPTASGKSDLAIKLAKKVNGEIINLFQSDFPYNNSRNIKIEFSFPSLEKVEENLFRYRLIGLNDTWSDWSTTTEGIFTNLYEGDYIFEVQALDANFNESEIESFLFSISPPWYRSYLAYFIYVLVIALSLIHI